MNKPKGNPPAAQPEALFGRIVTILEQARGNVVRAVNSNMVWRVRISPDRFWRFASLG